MAACDLISTAIRKSRDAGRPAIIGYVAAGFPTKERFAKDLHAIASGVDVIEIGVPFSDPSADGITIQHSSRVALNNGVSLKWILETLTAISRPHVPLLLMTYLNPLLAYGFDEVAEDSARAGISGFIVPDLPYEESTELRESLDRHGLALVQLVTPLTPDDRLAMLCKASQGFVYAVTMTGTTGKNIAVLNDVRDYLDRVRRVSPIPVCAGFGIRSREQVNLMDRHVDGVVVASALVELVERDEDPAAFLRSLRS